MTTEFSHRVRQQGLVSVIEVAGDVDMTVSPQLEAVVVPLVAAGDVVLDCTHVSFCDSMGLRVAVAARSQAEEAGTTFAIVPSEAVSRVLEAAGVASLFTILDMPPVDTQQPAQVCLAAELGDDGIMSEFACGTVDRAGSPVVVIWATGEVGPDVATRLGAEIEPHLIRGAVVVLTCAGITGIDPAGLGVLLHARRTAAEAGASFWLATAPQTVVDAIEAAGLGDAFTVHDTVAKALAEAGHPSPDCQPQGRGL